MEKRIDLRKEDGFTLIEIIAVLVILGILAAVAVPKFVDLQKQSRANALDAAFAAGASQAIMDYSEAILIAPNSSSTYTADLDDVDLGDFVVDIDVAAGGLGTITVTQDADGAVAAANYPAGQTFVSNFQCYTP